MAIPQDKELIKKVQQLHSEGLSDGKIAKLLSVRVNLIHHYRHYILKLPAHQPRRNYADDQEARLKGYIIRGVKSSAKRRGLDFDLKPDDLIINEYCPLLDIKLEYKNFLGKSEPNQSNYATVDRIDNSKGYISGNVWIISRLANSMKNNATKDQLKLFSENVLKNMI